jgi:hypothetical protein
MSNIYYNETLQGSRIKRVGAASDLGVRLSSIFISLKTGSFQKAICFGGFQCHYIYIELQENLPLSVHHVVMY